MKKIIVVLIMFLALPIMAGQLTVINVLSSPGILEVNGAKVEVYANGETMDIPYSGFSVTVKLYDTESKLIIEKSLDTPNGAALVALSGGNGKKYVMNLIKR